MAIIRYFSTLVISTLTVCKYLNFFPFVFSFEILLIFDNIDDDDDDDGDYYDDGG